MSETKVTFPHMGNMYICLTAVLEKLGVKVVVPPAVSKKTLSLGVQHGPEFACIPFKVNLGNYMEAYHLGANTILMAGGIGPCRFGYYAEVQREILRDLGYNYKMVVLEPPGKHISELVVSLKQITGSNSWWQIIKALRFGWQKAVAVDKIEKMVQRLRPRQLQPGAADKVYQSGLTQINLAQDRDAVKAAELSTIAQLEAIPANWDKPCLKIGLIGEIYVLLEPAINLEVERRLGELGVEVERSIYLNEWINEHLFMGLLKGIKNSKEAKLKARPYINYFIGGHGQESIGSAIRFQDAGFDGVIQLAPFTCMPEIVAQSVLHTVREDRDLPTLSLIIDEHAGEAGLITRLEAFVDLLWRRKQKKEAL